MTLGRPVERLTRWPAAAASASKIDHCTVGNPADGLIHSAQMARISFIRVCLHSSQNSYSHVHGLLAGNGARYLCQPAVLARSPGGDFERTALSPGNLQAKCWQPCRTKAGSLFGHEKTARMAAPAGPD